MGTTFACFHCFGILEVWSDNLINLVSDGAIVDPASFNILELILYYINVLHCTTQDIFIKFHQNLFITF